MDFPGGRLVASVLVPRKQPNRDRPGYASRDRNNTRADKELYSRDWCPYGAKCVFVVFVAKNDVPSL